MCIRFLKINCSLVAICLVALVLTGCGDEPAEAEKSGTNSDPAIQNQVVNLGEEIERINQAIASARLERQNLQNSLAESQASIGRLENIMAEMERNLTDLAPNINNVIVSADNKAPTIPLNEANREAAEKDGSVLAWLILVVLILVILMVAFALYKRITQGMNDEADRVVKENQYGTVEYPKKS
ncbi:MAG: hypothetical protein ACLFQ6_11420 [Candidatus Sumerlaeia bacterium]